MTYLFPFIPLLPLVAFVVIALGARWLGGASHLAAIPAVGLSFLLSVGALVKVIVSGPFIVPLITWLKSGSLVVEAGLRFDGLAAVLLVLVTAVGGLVHVFSSRYMQGDPRYARFFAVLALFTGSMLMLVLSTNLLLVYVFWEIMGLCSYLLISHAGERSSAARAATKVFLVNAVADVGLGLGILLTYRTFGTLDLSRILEIVPFKADEMINVLSWAGLNWPVKSLTLIGLLVFWGAMGKSAQVPLHVWLPYAMEAPTPVSALIHAATMVNAGVYVVTRLGPLYWQAPVAMVVVALVGGITAVFAATVALVQSDIKRILAYSTISQLGFMMLASGVGAPVAAVFHLVAHGALKAFLFLSAGSVLGHLPAAHQHAHAERAPTAAKGTSKPTVLLSLVLALFPSLLLYATPYRRLWTAGTGWTAVLVFWTLSLLLVFLAARAGSRWLAWAHDHPAPQGWEASEESSESRRWILSPRLLGVGVLGAALLFGGFAWFCSAYAALLVPVLAPSPVEPDEPEGWLAGLALGIFSGLIGCIVGWKRVQVWPALPAWLVGWKNRVYVFVLNDGYLDEIYDRWVVTPSLCCASWLWQRVDVGGVDRTVHALASHNVAVANSLWRCVEVNVIDRAVNGVASAINWSGRLLRLVQSGQAQHYALGITLGLALMLALCLLF